MNNNPAENGKNTRFTPHKQPANRGRKKSVFGPLAKENNLSLDDVRKVYKNILTAKSFSDLDRIKARYPSTLTDMTIDMLKQDKVGRLTGRKMTIKTNDGEKEIDERVKSYETVGYMLDRIYGTPTKVDLSVSGSLDVDVNDLSQEENDLRIMELMKELGYEQGKTE